MPTYWGHLECANQTLTLILLSRDLQSSICLECPAPKALLHIEGLSSAACMDVQVTGKCGSVLVRLIPAPRGAGIVAARTPKKVLQMAGIDDVYTAATGSTKTLGNFVKVCLYCCGWQAWPRPSNCIIKRHLSLQAK